MAEMHPFGHESPDVDTALVLKVVATLFGLLIVAVVALYFIVFHGVMSHHAEVVLRPEVTPPRPHLQPEPDADLARLRKQKRALLSGYAWVDPSHRFARIPIQRAMQLYVQEHRDDTPSATGSPDKRAISRFPAPFMLRYLSTNGGGLRQDTNQHQPPFALRYRRAVREFPAPFMLRYLTTNGGKAEARTPHQHPFALRYRRAVREFPAPFLLRYLSTNGGGLRQDTNQHQNPFALRYRRAAHEFSAPFMLRYLSTNGGGLRQDTNQHQPPFALRYRRAAREFSAPFLVRYLTTNGGKAEARTPHQPPFALRYRRAAREFPAPFMLRYLSTNGGGLRQDTNQHQNPFALRYRRAVREFPAPFLVRYLTTNGGKAETRTPHQRRLKWKDDPVRDDFPGFRTGGGRP